MKMKATDGRSYLPEFFDFSSKQRIFFSENDKSEIT